MKPEETVDFHIRWVWAKIARLYNHEASKYGGSMSVGYILLNIDKEGTHSTKLGPKMGMEARSLTRTLKTMEQEGLIYRQGDPEDGRMVRVFLTDEGRKQRENSKKVVLQFNQYLRSRVDPERFQVFLDVMQELNQLIDNPDIFPDVEEK